jgi:hypothetical protein
MMGEWFLVVWVLLTVLVAIIVQRAGGRWWPVRGEADG